MIERKFIEDKVKDLKIRNYLKEKLSSVGYSHAEIEKTPLGIKIVIYSSKPGLIVGRGGENIRTMTEYLEKHFKLDSPQIEVREVDNPDLDPQIMSERIAAQLSRFGASYFKAIGYRNLQRIMNAGAIGAEILISGRIPGSRAKRWAFRAGYLPKCGQVAVDQVLKGFTASKTKRGVTGIFVKILPPWAEMPDTYKSKISKEIEVEEIEENESKETKGNE